MKLITWLLAVAFLFTAWTCEQQSRVIEEQGHTIRQYMGLEDGPDATPQPPKAVVPPPPLPPKVQGPFYDKRRWDYVI